MSGLEGPNARPIATARHLNAGSGCPRLPVRSQPKDVFAVLLADHGEAALLKDADGADVVLGYRRVEGAARLRVAQEPRERLRGDALAPVLAADPVADLAFAGVLEAHHVAGHAPVEEDGLLGDALVGQDRGPLGHERVPVPGREAGHAVRDRVPLVLEEHGKVALRHVPQLYVARPAARFARGHLASSYTRPHGLVWGVPGTSYLP